MPTVIEFSDFFKTEFQAVPLAEALGLPPTVLLGVSEAAGEALETLGIRSVFDLAMSGVFNGALQIDDAADNAGNAMNRFGRPVSDLVDPGLSGTIKVTDLRFQDVGILAGVEDAAAVKAALGVVTVRDLAVYPPFRAAREILDKVFFPEKVQGFDAESPADLIPKTGEFPTERVQYTTLVLDEILRPEGAPELIDVASGEFAPVDITPVTDPNFGFRTLGLGALLTLNQSWFMQGVTLGHLLHSMALAPGESTRIAVVDWSRRTRAGQTEQVSETEDLTQDTSRNRSISEVTEAVAREAQTGFSRTESESTTKQAAASAGISIGPFGGGVSGSIAKTSASAESYSTTAGSREVGASMLQQATDRTHQHAHGARTRRASVVREVSQTEHENVSTRVVANYNHMHAMTVQYYEVLQVYRTETSLTRCDRVVFVPFKLLDFANEELLSRFRPALIDAALTADVRDALVNYETLEIVPERKVRFSGIAGTLADTILSTRSNFTMLARRPEGVDPGATEPPPGDPVAPPADPVGPVVKPRLDVVSALWDLEGSRLGRLLGMTPFRRGSESLFVPADVRVVDGEVVSAAGNAVTLAYHLKNGTRITALTKNVALSEIDRISLSGSSATADVEATATLTLSRNGVFFPLALPTVTVKKAATETRLVGVRAAGADVNLVEHLKDNRLHYSQAVFRNLDAAMIAGLLSPYSITLNGQRFPLVQVAEPVPLRIVGNALAFKINTDVANDEEWRTFMEERGLVIGQSKVDVIPLSSGGIFAEAVLGRFNCAEKLDMTRFWNWQDSPIPLQATDIAAIQTGTRATSEDLKPGALSAPIVNITPPAALPDPTGLAGAVAAVQNGNMFRDMSGLSETVKLATEAIKASSAGATSAGSQASKNMEVAVNADTERQRIAADLAKAKLGKPLADQNPSVQGAVVNKEEDLKKKAAEAAASSNGKSVGGSGTSGTGTSGSTSGTTNPGSPSGGGARTSAAPAPSTGNTALDRIIGNDDALRSFIGVSPDSPAPTPAVTAEGVPLQDWDYIATGYSLLYRASGATAEFASESQIEEIVQAGAWMPTDFNDVEPLTLGSRHIGGASFGRVLRALALMPAGSLRSLSIVACARGAHRLDFKGDFVFDKAQGFTFFEDDSNLQPLESLDLQEVVALAGSTAPIAVEDGVTVSLAGVRRAFPVDGEILIFNLYNPIFPDLVQAIANLFGVRATGFVEKPVRVLAEVIATGAEASERVLSKRVGVGSQGDPPGVTVEFFPNLLQEDRAVTGAYTAFPRRS